MACPRRLIELATQAAHLLAYWPLWDAAGPAAVDIKNARNGAYTGCTFGAAGIGDGKSSVTFDAVDDVCNIYTAGLAGAFSAATGTLMAWAKVSGAGVWTDNLARYVAILRADASNRLAIYKNTDNSLYANYTAGATDKTAAFATTQTGWMQLVSTWNKAGDAFKFYVNGLQVAATVTGLGVWVGALANNNTNIGARQLPNSNLWSGSLAHVAVWDTALTDTEIKALAQPTSGGLMLDFDDGRASVYTGAFPYMKAKGIRGTAYIVTDIIGTGGRMTWGQLQEMDAAGWDIGNHTKDHPANLTLLTQAEQEAEFTGAQSALEAHGLTRASKYVAYPGGFRDATTDAAMRAAGMVTGRISAGSNFDPKTVNLQQIAYSMTSNTTTPTDVELKIKQGAAKQYVAVEGFHDIGGATDMTLADFETVIDWIAANAIPVLTISEAYARAIA